MGWEKRKVLAMCRVLCRNLEVKESEQIEQKLGVGVCRVK